MILDKIKNIDFLEDVTEKHIKDHLHLPKMFKNNFKIFQAKELPELQFRISSDWEGNWLTGSWYYNGKQIIVPEELFRYLKKKYAVELAYNIDILEEMSTWKRHPRYIKPKPNYIEVEISLVGVGEQ